MHAHQRAAQIWPLLCLAAHNRQTVTYDMLSQLIGVPRPGLGQLLDPIQSYCHAKGLPHLTSLVVSEKTGLAGENFIGGNNDLPRIHAAVFQTDWLEVHTPTPDDLERAKTEFSADSLRASAETERTS